MSKHKQLYKTDSKLQCSLGKIHIFNQKLSDQMKSKESELNLSKNLSEPLIPALGA